MVHPLVVELADDGSPSRWSAGTALLEAGLRRRASPVTNRVSTHAHLTNAAVDRERSYAKYGYRFIADDLHAAELGCPRAGMALTLAPLPVIAACEEARVRCQGPAAGATTGFGVRSRRRTRISYGLRTSRSIRQAWASTNPVRSRTRALAGSLPSRSEIGRGPRSQSGPRGWR